MRRPAGLLFDLDGTLADTDPLHLAAFNALLAEVGREIDHAAYAANVMGAHNGAIFPYLFPEADAAAHDALADRKEALFRDSLARISPKPGTAALLDWAEAEGVPVALVTNAPRANAERMLAALDLARHFGVMVIGEEIARPKPDPLPYATAAALLGVAAADCLAFEDSLSGLRAAVAAGSETFALRGWLPDAALTGAGAAAILADFDDPALWRRLSAA